MSELKIIRTEDGSHSLLNETLNETYHSTHGAIQESLHVFIKNGLQYWLNKNQTDRISILEIGFGTGLNALLTLQASAKSQIKFHYTTIEAFPVSFDLANQLNYSELLNFESSEKLFQAIHRCEWNVPVVISSSFILEKLHAQIQKLSLTGENFDLVFFDAFAPGKQPEMWELPILERIVKSMRHNSVFVTYCAKGQVKRDLKSLGLRVESLPGPPGKREMVRALK